MMSIDRKNVASGLFFLLFGIAVAIGATRYSIGTASRMGPGYFPLGVGICLAIVGLAVLIPALRSGTASSLDFWPLRGAATVLAAVILFGVLLEPMGLLVAIPVLLIVSALAHPAYSWRLIGLSILILVPLTWVLFILGLGLQLPLLPFFLRA